MSAKTIVLVALVCGVTAGAALYGVTKTDSFGNRVKAGKAVEADAQYKIYFPGYYRVLTPQMQRTIHTCLPSKKDNDVDAFTLVADISPQGTAMSAQVKPVTPLTSCVVAKFMSFALPPPPTIPNRAGFPITLDMQLKN